MFGMSNVARLAHTLRHTIGRSVVDRFGYDHELWVRKVMYRECRRLLAQLDTPAMDALEISGEAWTRWRDIPFKSFM